MTVVMKPFVAVFASPSDFQIRSERSSPPKGGLFFITTLNAKDN
jgi:hypothetical protein